MKRFSLVTLLCGLALWGASVPLHAQARTWAFAKDTVYEWQSGTDTITVNGQKRGFAYGSKLSVTNDGVQPLRFDTVLLERIQSSFQTGILSLSLYDSAKSISLAQGVARTDYSMQWSCPSVGPCSYVPGSGLNQKPDTLPVRPSALYNFKMDSYTLLAKSSAATAIGDTVKYRAIFTGRGGRGRDTVIVVAIQHNPSAIAFPGSLNLKNPGPSSKLFDLRGRRVELVPGSLKASWAPVVSPKD
jgi:hypothetical protein